MNLSTAIQQVLNGADLSHGQMTAVMQQIMTGGATPAQIGGFLVGLRGKGETVMEIAAAAGVMRELATKVEVDGHNLVDTCGTGGDGAGIFNVSTAAAFVVASAGGRVAKHGNRSVSSRSGSADVLEAAGICLELSPEQVAQCIDKVGIGFLFTVRHHEAMRHALAARREMGVRTLFNLLGPLTNPALVQQQVLGVYADVLLRPMAEVLHHLGSRHSLVVHAEDGLDEISIAAPTHCVELQDGQYHEYHICPEDFGMQRHDLEVLKVDGPEQSLALLSAVLAGEAGPASDIVALNAGASLYVAGIVEDLTEGVRQAQSILASSAALTRMQVLAELTRRLAA